ncbi:Mei4p Ecym_4365 [Eremothecium cymbalariae DBVPG|uniref:Uncharacterized protein n=1 Tax=Eremothecium cymbalariae (strain CBS 270.75 / DBVPG 7215 / KCTC 17166 / NRRL Y-17582) TaxID=931890 RepID=G8JTS0_ERECY|nr:hypothetical protein Ecym_4365 [Eremothecium cymbalariae DBVPG\
MSWLLPTYRTFRWSIVLPSLPAEIFDVVNALQLFIVSHYSFHSGNEPVVKYVTQTLYYKFILEQWDKDIQGFHKNRHLGGLFREYQTVASFDWARLFRQQRRMIVMILRFRAKYNKNGNMVVRCVMYILQILESMTRCYLNLQRCGSSKPLTHKKAYVEIYNERSRNFDTKYVTEMMNVVKRHHDSIKKVEMMIKETFKLLGALNWKELQFTKKDQHELMCYRKFIQCSLLLTDNTTLIANFRLVINSWPTKS